MEVKMSKQKTRKGMASIYVVVFVTMLIGIITLSFLRIMLSESGRTEKSTLSDSALNSAMAGVEDAKGILAQYDQCEALNDTTSATCMTVRQIIDDKDGCNLGTEASSEEAVGISGADNRGDITDQAYTCVNISVDGNFKGRAISDTDPVLVVPLRVKGGDANIVDSVDITWSKSDNEVFPSLPSEYTANINKRMTSGVLGQKGVMNDDEPTKVNGLKVTLIQSGADYNINSFYAASGNQTNRSTLTIVPSHSDVAAEGSASFSDQLFVKAAGKTYNAPLRANCLDSDVMCSVHLGIPDPIGGNRIQDTFFLVISRLYSQPTIEDITITMLDSSGNEVDFHNVQPIIDATGRAGNLMRRVEVRLNPDYSSLVPLSELTVDGDLSKQFFVTKNCINGTEECVE